MDKNCACVDLNCGEAKEGKAVPFCGTAFVPQQNIDLSYEEQYAGFRDVDGRKVYSKTVELGSYGNSTEMVSNDIDVAHYISNMHACINYSVISLINSTDNYWVGPGLRSPDGYIIFNVTKQYVKIAIRRSPSNFSGRITLYYTCTDR